MDAIFALSRLGPFVLLSNAALTFGLNLASVELINVSSLVLSLSKVVKDILLIVAGMVVLHESATLIQLTGYSIALVGLYLFKMYG